MMAGDLCNRANIFALGLSRGLLQRGDAVERFPELVERIGSQEHPLGFNWTKPIVLRIIIDGINRSRRRRNPALNGSFTSQIQRRGSLEVVSENDPRKYFRAAVKELKGQVELEDSFIARFIDENPSLTAAAKDFMRRVVTVQIGPWYVTNHVIGVEQTETRIAVSYQNGCSYYYIR